MWLKIAFGLLLTLAVSSSPLQRQQASKGSIEVSVSRSDTGEPVRGGLVTVDSFPHNFLNPTFLSGRGSDVPEEPSTAQSYRIVRGTTNADGKVVLRNLDPGTYRIAATANGMVRLEYGQNSFKESGRPVYVDAGDTVTKIALFLVPAGTVKGRISNESGQPMAGSQIKLLQKIFLPEGSAVSTVATSRTDERGDFQLHAVAPGHYYMSVDPVSEHSGNPGSPMDRIHALTYFPGSEDPNGASVIEVQAGSELQANMTLIPQARYLLKGHIVDSQTGLAPKMAAVSVLYRTLSGFESIGTPIHYDLETGTFEASNVIRGDWLVQALVPDLQLEPFQSQDPLKTAAYAAVQGAQPFGQIAVTVTTSNIEGLVLTTSAGVSIPGRLALEDGQGNTVFANTDRVRVQLKPLWNGVADQSFARPRPVSQTPDPDGIFRIDGVRDGEYVASIEPPSADFYVKNVKYMGSEVLNTPFRISSQHTGEIEVTLSLGSGRLAGTVLDANSKPVPGVAVVLTPEPPEGSRSDSYKTTFTDRNGRYGIAGISPGTYRVLSLMEIERFASMDSEFIKKHEQQTQTVRIHSFASETCDITVIGRR